MKPVYQTTFGFGTGNCTQACIASILHIDLEEVPFFPAAGKDWDRETQRWLAQKHGLLMVYIVVPPGNVIEIEGGYYIAGGPTVRGIQHACVYYGSDLAHDPHPDGNGLTEVRNIELYVPCPAVPTWAEGDLLKSPREGGPTRPDAKALQELKELAKQNGEATEYVKDTDTGEDLATAH